MPGTVVARLSGGTMQPAGRAGRRGRSTRSRGRRGRRRPAARLATSGSAPSSRKSPRASVRATLAGRGVADVQPLQPRHRRRRPRPRAGAGPRSAGGGPPDLVDQVSRRGYLQAGTADQDAHRGRRSGPGAGRPARRSCRRRPPRRRTPPSRGRPSSRCRRTPPVPVSSSIPGARSRR